MLRNRVPPPASASSETSATYQRKTPLSNTRSTTWRLPSIHSYGCSRQRSDIPATRCSPLVDAPAPATDSISKRTGASPAARFIFSVFDTNGHSAAGDDCSSHSSAYVCTELSRNTGGAGCAVISAATPSHICSIALSSSVASAGRARGSFARHCATSSASFGLTSGTSASSLGGGSLRCWRISPIGLSSRNGARPAIIANRHTPSA